MGLSITSANATFLLSIASVYPNGVQIQQFGVDDAFSAEVVDAAETQVGVDAYSAIGYRPREMPMSIRLLANSSSIVVFENWIATEDQLTEKLPCSATILMPSVGRKYTMTLGTLMRISPMAEAKRVLQNREWKINWLPNGPGRPAISSAPI